MKLVMISDTHGYHRDVKIPPGDVLIHCGDFCSEGRVYDANQFFDWFSDQPHRHKIVIAGNHDLAMERRRREVTIPSSITYLENSGIEIEGKRFYGSPNTPMFFDWAFMRPRGADSARVWAKIWARTDVLITHGPPAGILDITALNFLTGKKEPQGCTDLLARVKQVKPLVHCFGHIHESYGACEIDGTKFFNAAICDGAYKPVRDPWTVEI